MMSFPDLIKKKRDGGVLSDEEIKTFIRAVTNKTMQEAQIGTESLNISIHTSQRHLITTLSSCSRGHTDGDLAEGNDWPWDWDADQGDDVIWGDYVMAKGMGGAGGWQTLDRRGGR